VLKRTEDLGLPDYEMVEGQMELNTPCFVDRWKSCHGALISSGLVLDLRSPRIEKTIERNGAKVAYYSDFWTLIQASSLGC